MSAVVSDISVKVPAVACNIADIAVIPNSGANTIVATSSLLCVCVWVHKWLIRKMVGSVIDMQFVGDISMLQIL